MPPKMDDCPGLVWKSRKDGWEARWQARTDLVKRGFEPKSVAICITGESPEPIEQAFISDRCKALQATMLVFGRGGAPQITSYDGTVASLINCYQRDPDSPFHKLRFKSREHYTCLMQRLIADCGTDRVADMKARYVLRLNEHWTGENQHIAMAHTLIAMMRTLATFGATILDDPDCRAFKAMMHDMRFKMPPPRLERLTPDQASLIRRRAHQMQLPSMALAQAFQTDCILRQKDVIGEWVPVTEPGLSDVTRPNGKWLRGIRWNEIDENLVLRHVTSKRGKLLEVPLREAPMVMEELNRLPSIPRSGPLIVYETTGLPYDNHVFRRIWRECADDVGIPKAVRNMDSRAGAISEATDAGIDLEHVRQAATHGDISMTQRYSRNGAEKTASVLRQRAAYRKKT